MLQLHPLLRGIQTTKAGFVWGEIEAKGKGILWVPFPAFSFCQISTNLVLIVAFCYSTLTRHPHLSVSRLQKYVCSIVTTILSSACEQTKLEYIRCIMLYSTSDREQSCRTALQLVQVITAQLKSVALSHFTPEGAKQLASWLVFPGKRHTAFTQVLDFGEIQRTDYNSNTLEDTSESYAGWYEEDTF